jgi:hypothetical protein
MCDNNEKSSTSIKGKLFDENNRGLGGVSIQCDALSTATLFDGSFKFDSVGQGTHIVSVVLEGYAEECEKVNLDEGETKNIEFHLEKINGDSKIWGYVLDAETSTPISQGGKIFLFLYPYNISRSINPATGYYEFLNLTQGTYKLGTSILEYKDETQSVTLGNEDTKRVDFYCSKREDAEPPWG